MKAVIMAGGESTRLKPLTCNLPKPMVPIVDRPVMEYIVELLARHGFNEIIVTLFYLPDAIREHFGDGSQFGVKMRYFVEDFPLGTAGSVRNARRHLDETFLVISGDTLTDIDLTQMVEYHQQKKSLATLALTRVDNPVQYGIVMNDDEGRVTRFLEKPGWAETFSDLANTGIYIFEPEIFNYFEDKQVFDFSKDLFPLLLAKDKPLYARLCPEYWCDIGSVQQYRQANIDVLNGVPDARIEAAEVNDGVFLGQNVIIAPGVRLEAPCFIGANTQIKEGAYVGAGTVIGRGSILHEGASIKRSVLWNNVYVGKKTELRGAIVCNHVLMRRNNSILEGAVIGDDCILEAHSHVRADVRIWPEKSIEAKSTVSSNMVWGTRLSKLVFGMRGISGVVNLEITPEYLAKVGAAYGTLIGIDKHVAVSCDTTKASKMFKRAFVSGILSTGVNVYDLGTATSGITRYSIRLMRADGGVQIRQAPEDDTALLVEFFDKRGLSIHSNTRNRIENIFSREAFFRSDAEGVGETIFLSNVIAQYMEGVMQTTDFQVIHDAGLKMALYYDVTNYTSFLPILLKQMGCEVVLPEGLSEGCRVKTLDDLAAGVATLQTMARAGKIDMGILMDQNADRLILVDEQGEVISEDQMMTLISFLLLKFTSRRAVPVSVAAPRVIEELAHEYDGIVLKAQELNSGLIVTEVTENRVLCEDDQMPEIQKMCAAIVSVVKILELMARDNLRFSELVATMPNFYIDRKEVHCPADEKARVMRMLIKECQDDQVELTEGIRLLHDEGWSLVLPDDEEPLFTIYTEASSLEKANEITQKFVARINELRCLDGKAQLGGHG
ncbi:MAG: NTP transferase domain-containing protein [Syntrophomonadaceae bacterium]|nr:NTP transferase domain-containing protein [Syntrophomonadaceae bacterium]